MQFIFSQFWKLEVQDQYHYSWFLLGLQMATFLLPLHMVIPLHVCVSLVSLHVSYSPPFIRTPVRVD